MNKVKQKTKAILSLPLAQRLLMQGFDLIHIEPSHRRRGKLAFVFQYSKELDQEITKYANGK